MVTNGQPLASQGPRAPLLRPVWRHSPAPTTNRPSHDRARIVLLDDHPAVRAGLQAILKPESDLELVGVAGDEHELWPLIAGTRPTVVVLDLHHPGRHGLNLTLRVKRLSNAPSVIVHSAYTPPDVVVAAAVAGADATVNKSSHPAVLLAAIRAVASPLHPAPVISRQMRITAAARLDPTEHAVLAMRLAGHSVAEISATLGANERAIANRIIAIVNKLETVPRLAIVPGLARSPGSISGSLRRSRSHSTNAPSDVGSDPPGRRRSPDSVNARADHRLHDNGANEPVHRSGGTSDIS